MSCFKPLIVLAMIAALGCGDMAVPRPEALPSAITVALSPSADEPPQSVDWPNAEPLPNVPAWAVDAVFYQIFPERFRNGDPTNDPTRESLEFPDAIPASWKPTPWTGDWYARADWEVECGDNFYEHGVFNRRYGGDLQGVIDKLDYLKYLGVNALYFNPVFYGRSLHKYDGGSMHHIDPHFGPDPAGDFALMRGETADPATWRWTAADQLFLKLLEEARQRGIRVIIDGVFNHTGRDFFAFADVAKHGRQSPYADWYVVAHFDDPDTPANEFQYRGWWGNATLPEFADNATGDDLHPGPKAYVLNVTRRWMDPNGDGDPSDGVDGWRLDVTEEVPLPFWQEWNRLVRQLNPEAYTVAEIWNDASRLLVEGGFSATMNYHAFAFPTKGYVIDGRMTPHDFGRELQRRRDAYPAAMQFAMQNLIDSHDTDRVASMIVNRPTEAPYKNADRFDFDEGGGVSPRYNADYQIRPPTPQERRLQRMAALMQMTYVGPPMIYYGDEVGMWGADDPCDRCPMVWNDLDYAPLAVDPWGRTLDPIAVKFDDDLHCFYRDAIALRHSLPVLRQGNCTTIATDAAAMFVAFRRTLADATALVAFNRGDQPYLWNLPLSDPDLRIVLSTDDAATLNPNPAGDGSRLELPPWSAAVLAAPRAGAASQQTSR